MKALTLFLTLLLLCSAAGASYVQIISSFNPSLTSGSVTWYAYSIEYDGTNLWTAVLYHLAKRTYPNGSLLSTYNIDPYQPYGMAYDGTYIYSTNAASSYYVYKLEPTSGSTAASFHYPSGATYGTGLAFGAGSLYFTDYVNARLWRLTTNGSVLSSSSLAITKPWGLAYDNDTPGGPYVWCANHPWGSGSQSYIYKLTTAGSIIESAPWPMAGVGACGLAFDGTYLWGINNVFGTTHLALQMLYVSDVAVRPASLGRIKAMFR